MDRTQLYKKKTTLIPFAAFSLRMRFLIVHCLVSSSVWPGASHGAWPSRIGTARAKVMSQAANDQWRVTRTEGWAEGRTLSALARQTVWALFGRVQAKSFPTRWFIWFGGCRQRQESGSDLTGRCRRQTGVRAFLLLLFFLVTGVIDKAESSRGRAVGVCLKWRKFAFLTYMQINISGQQRSSVPVYSKF